MAQIFSYRDSNLYSHHSVDALPDPDAFQMHVHEMVEIYYFISGDAAYLVEGSSYRLEPGDIMIMRPAEAHRLMISPNAPYERIAIHFSTALLTDIDPTLSLLRPFLARPLGQGNHYRTNDPQWNHLRVAFRDFDFQKVSDVRLNLIGRLLLFLTALNGGFRVLGSQQISDATFHGQLVRFVNTHLFEPLSLQTVADHFYRSRSQISRTFRQATGSSFWEYILIKRLLAAQAMIQRGEKAGAAALACGFSDYSVFYRAYTNHFGHSPKHDSG